MDSALVAKKLIEYSHHMVIATADIEAKPWVSPVFYMYDKRYNLYWVSDKSSLHSRNIRSNPHIAISIFGPFSAEDEGRIHGVYIDADAVELTAEADIAYAAQ